jgi:hypothetical protein
MPKSDVLRMRVTPQEKEAFEEAARIAGASFSTWARVQLRRAAIREFEDAGRRVDFQPQKEVPHGGRDRV